MVVVVSRRRCEEEEVGCKKKTTGIFSGVRVSFCAWPAVSLGCSALHES